MWFKNVRIYRLGKSFNIDANELEEKLQTRPVTPCGKVERFRYGWASPFGEQSEVLVHAVNGKMLFASCKEEKILPASVIKEHLIERINTIQETEARKVYRKEKMSLRDEIEFDLLPKAFSKKQTTFLYIDPELKLLIVDTTSQNKAEEILAVLRDTLGSLTLELIQAHEDPSCIMSGWLLQRQMPAHFTIEDSCEMLNVKQGVGLIKCKQQDLFTDEIHAHIKNGKQVTSMALSWNDRLTFVLNDDLSIKGIKRLDSFSETDNSDEPLETAEQQLDADFVMMSGEFAQFLPEVFSLFGGLIETAKAVTEEKIAEEM